MELVAASLELRGLSLLCQHSFMANWPVVKDPSQFEGTGKPKDAVVHAQEFLVNQQRSKLFRPNVPGMTCLGNSTTSIAGLTILGRREQSPLFVLSLRASVCHGLFEICRVFKKDGLTSKVNIMLIRQLLL